MTISAYTPAGYASPVNALEPSKSSDLKSKETPARYCHPAKLIFHVSTHRAGFDPQGKSPGKYLFVRRGMNTRLAKRG
jgi:hypothetical protein